ncbi:FtsK/SpoIIIE domain-containing protein [Lactiplantibacillus plantarum]|uniref:FtsK/SpoIIIE domain-containing protein n=1 Tax=Lactiplantibacillus plantarum TaxID=1590 RepID=UPI002001C6F6|nr:FtsK/SpoIIIE domain-containing protein [Lactiplantibacillus plantarum]
MVKLNQLSTGATDPTDAVFGIAPDNSVVHYPLSTAPHLLIAGTTGSGKSVFINQVLITMMVHALPTELKFVIVDPKKVEFTAYKGLPYMLADPVTDMGDALAAALYLTKEMDERYEKMAEVGGKNLPEYNEYAEEHGLERWPYIIMVVDELSDLMGQHPEVEAPLIRLGQKARAAGIHVILATQSPRREVITGLIKANFPSRISLMVASSLESEIIMDETGGEKLSPHGDMLIKMNGGTPVRAQGAYISNPEIAAIFKHLRESYPIPEVIHFDSESGAIDANGKPEVEFDMQASLDAINDLVKEDTSTSDNKDRVQQTSPTSGQPSLVALLRQQSENK